MKPMVIIGGGLAAARGIINLRANNYDGPITMISEEALLPYDRPPLSKSAITDDEPKPAELLDDGIVASLKAEVLLGVAVIEIDRANKTVHLANGTSVAYEKLLLATGAKPRRLNIPGGEHTLTLRDFKDALKLRKSFQPGKNIVIIGGGFIGLELAASASQRGCNVTLVEAQPRILMRGVPEVIAKIIHARHETAGITVLTGTGLTSLSSDAVHLADGRVIKSDTVIAGIGASPEIKLAEAAGLTIENGIACNEFMQTSDLDIYAAGDCCSFINTRFGNRRIRIEAWRSAQEQSATAAENMLGGTKSNASIPWFWSDQHDLSLQITGMADMGPITITRKPSQDSVLLFHTREDGKIMGASGIGVGNSIGREIKLVEMLIQRNISPSAAVLSDAAQPLKALLKG